MRTVALFIFSTWLLAFAQSNSPGARDAVVQLEQRWLASENDPNALESILAEDFVHVLPTGIITKQQQLAYQRSHPRRDEEKRWFDELNVRVFGEAAVATGAVSAVGENGAERKTYFTDVFANRNGRWRAVSAEETSALSPKPK